MRFKGEDGQITVFLSIILVAVLLVAGVLVDGARIRSGEVHAKRSVDIAARAVLADYLSPLKNEYGIFALAVNDQEQLKEEIQSYINLNLMTEKPEARYTALYKFRVENVEVHPIYNLSENRVTRSQILEYMKYRAPKEMVESLMEKLLTVKASSSMSEAYKYKTKVDRLSGKMAKYQEKLKQCIDGEIDGRPANGACVNKYNLGGSRDRRIEKYEEASIAYIQYSDSLKILETEIEDTEEGEKLDELIKNKKGLLEQINIARKEWEKSYEVLYHLETQSFLSPNRDALKNIEGIKKQGREVKLELEKLKAYLEGRFDSSHELSQKLKDEMTKDITRLDELLVDGEKCEDISRYLEANIAYINSMLIKINEINQKIATNKGEAIYRGAIANQLAQVAGSYNNSIRYEYNYTGQSGGSKEKDTRLTEAAAAGKIFKNIIKADKKIDSSEQNTLPSVKKIISKDFSLQDSSYMEKNQQDDESPAIQASYKGSLDNIGDEISFDEGHEEGFAENAFGFIGSMGQMLQGELKDIRDEIYVNEYIMGIFKNSVPKLSGTNKTLDLQGRDKSKRETFFDSEVEYILHGKSSQNLNETMTKGQVLIVRFGLNTLHVYLDQEKRELANITATAVAGWWTAGAGIPIISNLIMCGWGMGEAVKDVSELMEGKAIPFYKLRGDWKLNIGLPVQHGPKSDSRLNFNYHDYLRLLLLTMNSKDKVDRVADLIQLNMKEKGIDHEIGKFNTYLRIEVDISMNYLFMTQAFMPSRKKTRDGRHMYNVVIYRGY